MPTATTKPPTVPPSIERLLLLPLIALPILWLAGYFFPPINHDVAAILDVSARWVNGERLYVEVIDENLPLTFVVHALPVLTSKILPGDPSFWFTAWVVAGIFASFWACRRLVKLVPSADHAAPAHAAVSRISSARSLPVARSRIRIVYFSLPSRSLAHASREWSRFVSNIPSEK